MKKITYFFALILVGMSLLTSCENELLEGEFFSTPDGSDPAEFCENAPADIAIAQAALFNAPAEQQAQLCDALQATITNAIVVCGDPTGIFQALLDDLGSDCMVQNDDDDDDDDGSDDAIVGEWTFVRDRDFVSVDGEIIIDEIFVANECTEQGRQIFLGDGSYGFVDWDNVGPNCEIISSSDSGNWINTNGIYQINYDDTCVGLDCPDQDEVPTSVMLIDANTLRIQFGNDTPDADQTINFFFSEYVRL